MCCISARNENGFRIVVIIDKRISIRGIFVLFVCAYYQKSR